jgi:hypothetical protein
MPCSSHHPWLDLSNYTWRRVQLMKLLNTQFSPTCSHCISLPSKLFSLAPCSQTPSIYVRPLMSQTLSFTPIHNHMQSYTFAYSNFYVFRQQTRRQKLLDWMVVSITRIQSALNFLLNQFWFVTVGPKYLNCATFSRDPLAIVMSWFCPAFWWRDRSIYLAFSAFSSNLVLPVHNSCHRKQRQKMQSHLTEF